MDNIDELGEREVYDIIQQNKLEYMDFIRWVDKVSSESFRDGMDSVEISWFE